MTRILYSRCMLFVVNDTATTEIYTISLHDALRIYPVLNFRLRRQPAEMVRRRHDAIRRHGEPPGRRRTTMVAGRGRSEEHTSELQSRQYLVCRLLLENKQHKQYHYFTKSHQ